MLVRRKETSGRIMVAPFTSISCYVIVLLIPCYLEVITQKASAYTPERVDFRLVYFYNPGNRTAHGFCCDGNKTAPQCSDGCDVFFKVCTFNHCADNRANHSQVIFHRSIFRWQGKDLEEHGPSLVTLFPPSLWEDTPFTVYFFDDDTIPESNGSLSSELMANYTGILSSELGKNWTLVTYSNRHIKVKLLYRIKCLPYFYQTRCQKYCKPRYNQVCLANGTKACRQGYTEPNCNTAICPNSCSKHGFCQSPGNCSCYAGWKGPDCSQCVPMSPCAHGTCTHSPQNCKCDADWTGNYCNIHINYCSLVNPCKNNAVCRNDPNTNYTCQCTPDYDGPNCERFVCSSTCNLYHADCVPGIGCRCHSGWTGRDCTQCIKPCRCFHGYLVTPDHCRCYGGWIGARCDVSLAAPLNCSTGNPCQYNASCETLGNGTSRCICKKGFTGKYCENDTRCHESCNTTNGFCEGDQCSCNRGWQGQNCNQCIKSATCVHGFCEKPFECICHEGWTGSTCNQRASESCSSTCNKSHGFCDEDNRCRCDTGWQGPDCNQCIRNSSCVNGYCNEPFECICWSGWSGLTCNITNCNQPSERNTSCEEPSVLTSSKGVRAVYISSAIGVLVFAVLLTAFYFLWRHFRRRAEFCVTTPEVFVNNNHSKQSYHQDDKIIISSMNNNFNELRDLAKDPDIIRNKMFVSQDLPLNSISNGKTKTLNRSDSGFVEEGILPNAVKY